MRHRWANTSLLILVVLQVATGSFGLAAGSADRSAFLWLHNTGAFAIVIVLIWKSAIGVRSLKRPASGRPRTITLVLTLLLAVTLILGFTWPAAGYWSVSGTSGITLHIWAGLALTPLLGYHSWRYTRRFKGGYDADRRAAIRLFVLGGAGYIAWLAVEGSYRGLGFSAANRRFTGSHERRSFTGNAFPTTSWLNDKPDPIDRDTWHLSVSGPGDDSMVWNFSDLTADSDRLAQVTMEVTLDCTGGWYSTQSWRGVLLQDVINSVAHQGTRSIEVVAITGYHRKYSFDAAKNFLLATHVGEEPLSHRHGAPVRLVAPGRRGFEWVKWVTGIRLSESSHWLQPPFPLQ